MSNIRYTQPHVCLSSPQQLTPQPGTSTRKTSTSINLQHLPQPSTPPIRLSLAHLLLPRSSRRQIPRIPTPPHDHGHRRPRRNDIHTIPSLCLKNDWQHLIPRPLRLPSSRFRPRNRKERRNLHWSIHLRRDILRTSGTRLETKTKDLVIDK